jgi:hypothetical protein
MATKPKKPTKKTQVKDLDSNKNPKGGGCKVPVWYDMKLNK